MASDPASPGGLPPKPPADEPPAGTAPPALEAKPHPTRSGVVWVAVVVALLLLVLLIIFILQN